MIAILVHSYYTTRLLKETAIYIILPFFVQPALLSIGKSNTFMLFNMA